MSSRHAPDEGLYRVSDDRLLSMADLLRYFIEAGTRRVSDLHLKAGRPPTYRIDGALQPMNGPPLDAETVAALVEAVISDEEIAAYHRDRALDSSATVDDRLFRLSFFFDADGPAAAVRALDAEPIPVDQIGFPNGVWEDILARREGLVLVTGITGAGKSTTIASLITEIARRRACRIVTLEDPIEYRLFGEKAMISQREVGRDVLTYARGLRDSLRQDPDVMLVGEMRDQDSAMWTMTAAETGHLVFSTLHTRDARGTVTRLLDMFPVGRQEEVASQLSLSLAYVVSQKLIPRRDGAGRVAAMEILHNTPAVANIIRNRKVEQLYTQMQSRTRDIPGERMTTLERSLALLASRNVIDVSEANRWAHDPATMADELRRANAPLPPPPAQV